MQYVSVKFDGNNTGRTYTYQWSGETLKQGDRVVVPGNYFNADPQLATVEAVTPHRDPKGYQGALTNLLGYYDAEGQLKEV